MLYAAIDIDVAVTSDRTVLADPHQGRAKSFTTSHRLVGARDPLSRGRAASCRRYLSDRQTFSSRDSNGTVERAPYRQSGRNRWQPVANGMAAKTARTSQHVAVGCHWLPVGAHGKEGVDGSSPSEGLKYLQISIFCCLFRRGAGVDHRGSRHEADLQGLLFVIAQMGGPRGTLRQQQQRTTFRPLRRGGAPERGSLGSGFTSGRDRAVHSFSADPFVLRREAEL